MIARTFRRYRLDEYIATVLKPAIAAGTVFTAVHVHATWKPTKAAYYSTRDKEQLIKAMWRFHTSVQKWSDIAQHATIDPDGYIWDGRPLNIPPASATGYNEPSSDNRHPFMFEMVGNFDTGCEKLEGAQLQAAVGLSNAVVTEMKGSLAMIHFHNEMTDYKTCPGSGVDKSWFLAQVMAAQVSGLSQADAQRIISFLQAYWKNAVTKELKDEIHRLADEVRKAAGIPIE